MLPKIVMIVYELKTVYFGVLTFIIPFLVRLSPLIIGSNLTTSFWHAMCCEVNGCLGKQF